MTAYITQWLQVFGLPPIAGLAILVAVLLPVAFLWRLEYSLPDKMGATWMRIVLLVGSIVLGPIGAVIVWHTWSALVLGLIFGLFSELGRQFVLWALARWFPGVTSIPKPVLKVEANGDVGIKVGDNPTVMLTPQEKEDLLAKTGGQPK